jgi:hypothetical protein
MHPGLALVDGKIRFRVSTTNVKSHLHGHWLFFGDGFNFENLLVHEDYTRRQCMLNMMKYETRCSVDAKYDYKVEYNFPSRYRG